MGRCKKVFSEEELKLADSIMGAMLARYGYPSG